jgi:hypothetical protein
MSEIQWRGFSERERWRVTWGVLWRVGVGLFFIWAGLLMILGVIIAFTQVAGGTTP